MRLSSAAHGRRVHERVERTLQSERISCEKGGTSLRCECHLGRNTVIHEVLLDDLLVGATCLTVLEHMITRATHS